MSGREDDIDHPQDLLLASMAGLVPAVEPAADVRERLRMQLLAKIAAPRMRVLRAGEGEWRPLLPGIRIKTLHRSNTDGCETTLWRIEPGAQVPPHPHRHEEECLILEGSVIHAGIEYHAGDYLLAEAGMHHEVFMAPRGALLLIRSEAVPDQRRMPNPGVR